jgi:hypothetical protein
MKRFSTLTLYLVITLMLSACGARGEQATPAMNPVDLQGTVAAAAFTVIAETQAAIPTATPPPPTATFTDTPLPTETLPPLPPPGGTFTPAPGGNSGGNDPCIYKVMPETLKGEPVRVRLDNSTKAKVSVTVYLNPTVPYNQCGYRSYTIDPGQYIVIGNLVEGCYSIWAWDPNPDTYFMATNGTSCLNTSDSYVFGISTSSIKLGP